MAFPDYLKSAISPLLATLTVLLFWQVAGAADLENGRHSLIRRPQVPVINPIPSPAKPSALTPPVPSPPPPHPLRHKIVRRPATPSAVVTQASPTVSTSPAQTDP